MNALNGDLKYELPDKLRNDALQTAYETAEKLGKRKGVDAVANVYLEVIRRTRSDDLEQEVSQKLMHLYGELLEKSPSIAIRAMKAAVRYGSKDIQKQAIENYTEALETLSTQDLNKAISVAVRRIGRDHLS